MAATPPSIAASTGLTFQEPQIAYEIAIPQIMAGWGVDRSFGA